MFSRLINSLPISYEIGYSNTYIRKLKKILQNMRKNRKGTKTKQNF